MPTFVVQARWNRRPSYLQLEKVFNPRLLTISVGENCHNLVEIQLPGDGLAQALQKHEFYYAVQAFFV
jgi:hypothetical protein